ncbi:MAG TPA: hypothetical protein VJB57_12800 [Dehalococcoidia bacterium]|nr:hypothetical protein [Dehalococcoidia bacterium]
MTLGRVLAATAAAITFLFISQTASAQYPPPDGSLICQLSQSRVDANSNVFLTVRLIDTFGNAKPGERVNFGIVSSNGTASLSNSFGITDSFGQTSTTVFVGSGFGRIEVTATAQNAACRAVIDPITPTPTPTPVRTVAPAIVRQATPVIQVLGAAVASSVITPPQTGDGGLQDSSGDKDSTALYLIGAVELIAVLAWVIAGRVPAVRSK